MINYIIYNLLACCILLVHSLDCPRDIKLGQDTGQATRSLNIQTFGWWPVNKDVQASVSLPYEFGLGRHEVTFRTATETCTARLTILDLENPKIACPTSRTIILDPGKSYSTSEIVMAQFSDNSPLPQRALSMYRVRKRYDWESPGPSITEPLPVNTITIDGTLIPVAATAQYPLGSTEVFITVTDVGRNIASCSTQVLAQDRSPPSISCKPYPNTGVLQVEADDEFTNTVRLDSLTLYTTQRDAATMYSLWGNLGLAVGHSAEDNAYNPVIALTISTTTGFKYLVTANGTCRKIGMEWNEIDNNTTMPCETETIPAGNDRKIRFVSIDGEGNSSPESCPLTFNVLIAKKPNLTCPTLLEYYVDAEEDNVNPDGSFMFYTDTILPNVTFSDNSCPTDTNPLKSRCLSLSPGSVELRIGRPQDIIISVQDRAGHITSCNINISPRLISTEPATTSIPTTTHTSTQTAIETSTLSSTVTSTATLTPTSTQSLTGVSTETTSQTSTMSSTATSTQPSTVTNSETSTPTITITITDTSTLTSTMTSTKIVSSTSKTSTSSTVTSTSVSSSSFTSTFTSTLSGTHSRSSLTTSTTSSTISAASLLLNDDNAESRSPVLIVVMVFVVLMIILVNILVFKRKQSKNIIDPLNGIVLTATPRPEVSWEGGVGKIIPTVLPKRYEENDYYIFYRVMFDSHGIHVDKDWVRASASSGTINFGTDAIRSTEITILAYAACDKLHPSEIVEHNITVQQCAAPKATFRNGSVELITKQVDGTISYKFETGAPELGTPFSGELPGPKATINLDTSKRCDIMMSAVVFQAGWAPSGVTTWHTTIEQVEDPKIVFGDSYTFDVTCATPGATIHVNLASQGWKKFKARNEPYKVSQSLVGSTVVAMAQKVGMAPSNNITELIPEKYVRPVIPVYQFVTSNQAEQARLRKDILFNAFQNPFEDDSDSEVIC
eukprot:m.7159 g.7159  ORF g.7159 m.7159 type:complete len:953 (-) comp3655_c0_seq1:202-3060(-)